MSQVEGEENRPVKSVQRPLSKVTFTPFKNPVPIIATDVLPSSGPLEGLTEVTVGAA